VTKPPRVIPEVPGKPGIGWVIHPEDLPVHRGGTGEEPKPEKKELNGHTKEESQA
jgi:hypothetical protein